MRVARLLQCLLAVFASAVRVLRASATAVGACYHAVLLRLRLCDAQVHSVSVLQDCALATGWHRVTADAHMVGALVHLQAC